MTLYGGVHQLPFPFGFQGDVWICMEVMDTSLDKFYKMIYPKDQTIPEEVLGKIAVSVSRIGWIISGLWNVCMDDARYSAVPL